MPNMCYQINSAINDAFTPGRSKRSDKFTRAGLEWRVYSYNHKDALHVTGKEFAGFCQARGVRRLCDIRPHHVQAYYDYKATTCNSLTLAKLRSHLIKLNEIAVHKFGPMAWGVDLCSLPVGSRGSGIVKDRVMTVEDYEAVRADLAGRESLAWRALDLSALLGLRVEETVGVRVGDIVLDQSEDGFGRLVLGKGRGSKGNRPRVVPIPTLKARERLASMIDGLPADSLIVYNAKTGDALTQSAVSKAITRALDRLGLAETYRGNLNHSLRKRFATDYFAAYRSCHTRKQTVERVNEILGHGRQRSEAELMHYVHEIF